MIELSNIFNKNQKPTLKFGDHDLVYGPKADGALRKWQQRHGENLLDDVADPYYNGFAGDWIS